MCSPKSFGRQYYVCLEDIFNKLLGFQTKTFKECLHIKKQFINCSAQLEKNLLVLTRDRTVERKACLWFQLFERLRREDHLTPGD